MLSRLSCLIIDDESGAVTLLTKLLQDLDEFDEIRSADSAASANLILQVFQPHLIFLDIRLPGQNGISYLRELHDRKISSEIILVTAYEEYALDALRNHAFGFLLKPVNRTELIECVKYFRSRKSHGNIDDRIGKILEALDSGGRIRINTRTGFYLLALNDILYGEADGNYTRIETGERGYLCSFQLGELEKMLPAKKFLRLGRSLIVNVARISIVDRKKLTIMFELNASKHTMAISRSQLKELEKGTPYEPIRK